MCKILAVFFFPHLQDLFESCLLRMEDNSLLHQYLEFRDFINVPQVIRSSVQMSLKFDYKLYLVVFERGHTTAPLYTCVIKLKPSVSCCTELIVISTRYSMKFQWQLKYTWCMYRALRQADTDLCWKMILAHLCHFLANLLLDYTPIWTQQTENSSLVYQPWDFNHWS